MSTENPFADFITDRDGDVHCLGDLLAEVGRIALERGKRLDISETATGEWLYRLVDA